MGKGLDGKFINYGIRQDDLMLISTLCEKHQVDFEWLERRNIAQVSCCASGQNRNERCRHANYHCRGYCSDKVKEDS